MFVLLMDNHVRFFSSGENLNYLRTYVLHFCLPAAVILKTAPVKKAKFGEQDGRYERHFQKLLEADVHHKLVLLFLGHERRHAGAASVCHADVLSGHPSNANF